MPPRGVLLAPRVPIRLKQSKNVEVFHEHSVVLADEPVHGLAVRRVDVVVDAEGNADAVARVQRTQLGFFGTVLVGFETERLSSIKPID